MFNKNVVQKKLIYKYYDLSKLKLVELGAVQSYYQKKMHRFNYRKLFSIPMP